MILVSVPLLQLRSLSPTSVPTQAECGQRAAAEAGGPGQLPGLQARLSVPLWEAIQADPALQHSSCLFCSFGTSCLVTSCTAPLRGSVK